MVECFDHKWQYFRCLLEEIYCFSCFFKTYTEFGTALISLILAIFYVFCVVETFFCDSDEFLWFIRFFVIKTIFFSSNKL